MKKLKITESITSRESDAFKKYLTEVANIPLLTVDEEYEIATLIDNGIDVDNNVNKLVRHNLRFVISVAKQYDNNNLKLEDLVNEGNEGLIKAARKFDPKKGFKFISYAVWWIRRGILAYMTEHGRAIRLPNNKNNIMQKIKAVYISLEQKLERAPSYDELYDALEGGYSMGDVSFFMDDMATNVVSLDKKIDNDGSSSSFSDLIKDNDAIESDFFTDMNDSNFNVNRLLNVLNNDKERQVLVLLFGLNGKDGVTLKTVGNELGISSERVRQLRDSGLFKLRNALSKVNQN